MAIVNVDIPDALAVDLRKKAESKGMSLSAYLVSVLPRPRQSEWPPNFFTEVVGGWAGEPLERSGS